MTNQSLQGRIAMITGASRGLGKQMAEALAGAGAAVALAARNLPMVEAVRASILAAGGRAEAFAADVTDEAQVAELAIRVRERLGVADILINNAGINVRKPITEFTLQEWHSVLETNLTGAFLCCRAFVPGMIEAKFGRILNMTSIMSHVSLPGRAAYSASKSGLLGMTRALALELAPHGIPVTVFCQGPSATEMNKPLMEDPARNAEFLSKIPLGRWGRVEEIGALAVYLCSGAAGFITGADILIDGGWTAQ